MAEVQSESLSLLPSQPRNASPSNFPHESQPDTPTGETKVSRGRRPTFTYADDLIVAREVAAANAHIAPYGEVQKRFALAAQRTNTNMKLS